MSLYVRDWKYREATSADILAAIRDLGYLVVRGVTCETCGGSGYDPIPAEPEFDVDIPCSANCVNGLVASPEAIEAGGSILDGAFDVPPITAKIMAKAALMAAVDTETQ